MAPTVENTCSSLLQQQHVQIQKKTAYNNSYEYCPHKNSIQLSTNVFQVKRFQCHDSNLEQDVVAHPAIKYLERYEHDRIRRLVLKES